ncbi:RICIN domain-containing protein [Streptomyces sp. Root264]|uniref:RICIN domain-containing protein n=1 Tax=Streptomyces sp. Root264 TaxID=1736503 RepID=UPI00070F45EA|nr:RICIN domain-containing protein [Streptomyces sp. Root264]KRD24625.1 hypothetical protein ASE41_02305 [Streptomyces sp. Root264]
MGRAFRTPLALAAAALLAAPLLTASSLTGTASAATAATAADTASSAEAADTPVYARLYNQGTGLCLAVPGADPPQGTKLVQWRCSTSASQYWALLPVADGYQVRNLGTGLCLAMGKDTKDKGATAIQWPCNGGDAADDAEQVWTHDDIDRLKNKNSQLCLAILGTATAEKTEAQQWDCGTNGDQQWLW